MLILFLGDRRLKLLPSVKNGVATTGLPSLGSQNVLAAKKALSAGCRAIASTSFGR